MKGAVRAPDCRTLPPRHLFQESLNGLGDRLAKARLRNDPRDWVSIDRRRLRKWNPGLGYGLFRHGLTSSCFNHIVGRSRPAVLIDGHRSPRRYCRIRHRPRTSWMGCLFRQNSGSDVRIVAATALRRPIGSFALGVYPSSGRRRRKPAAVPAPIRRTMDRPFPTSAWRPDPVGMRKPFSSHSSRKRTSLGPTATNPYGATTTGGRSSQKEPAEAGRRGPVVEGSSCTMTISTRSLFRKNSHSLIRWGGERFSGPAPAQQRLLSPFLAAEGGPQRP